MFFVIETTSKELRVIDTVGIALEHVVAGAKLIGFSESPDLPKGFLTDLMLAHRGL